MKNFESFVGEFYEYWQKKYPKLRGFKVNIEMPGEAENYIKNLLIEKGYDVFIKDSYRIPANIYAIKDYGTFYHIWLLQVKTRRIGKYNSNDIKSRDVIFLMYQTALVRNHFYRSKQLTYLYNKPLIVSSSDVIVDFYKEEIKIGLILLRKYNSGRFRKGLSKAKRQLNEIIYHDIMSKNVFSKRIFNQLDKEDMEWTFKIYKDYLSIK